MKGLFKTDFFRSASTITIANVVANVIAAFNFFLIAKIFSQESVGHYSVFIAISAIVGAVSLGAYHLELPSIISEKRVDQYLSVLVFFSITSSSIAIVVSFCAGYKFSLLLGLYVFSLAIIQICDQVNIRMQKIKVLAIFRVLLHLVFAGGVVAISKAVVDAQRLVELQTLCALIVSLSFCVVTVVQSSLHFEKIPIRSFIAILKEFKRAPLYVAPSHFFLVMTYQFPTILIETYFGAPMAAQYQMTVKFCAAPVQVLGGGLGQAYHGRLAHWIRVDDRSFYPKFQSLTRYLWLGGVTVMLVVLLIYPSAINLVLGEQWQFSGQMARVLSPLYGMMFAVMPLGMAFIVLKSQEYLLFNQFWGFVNSLIGFGVGIFLEDLLLGVSLFSILSVIRYIFIYKKIKKIHCEFVRN